VAPQRNADTLEAVNEELQHLEPGQPIVYGGNRVVRVSPELAAAFQPGDRLVVVNETGALLHIPSAEWAVGTNAVGRAASAFAQMGEVSDDQISQFFTEFAARLADDTAFGPIAEANAADVEAAKARGRSTTRLVLGDKMRADMIAGLQMWGSAASSRDVIAETVDHPGWRVEQVVSGLGVVGFVFEGRPNVFADASGVLRNGNTVVFRIGSDALGTARSIVTHALDPALATAGLPEGSASLVDSAAHAAGWAMFSDPRLGLAVARGSGAAVDQLGAVARQVGTPVSLHGTGGAWIFATEHADLARLESVVAASLDRKVCNTLNTFCAVGESAPHTIAAVLRGLEKAASQLGTNPKVHVAPSAEAWVPEDWFARQTPIARAEGDTVETPAELISDDQLGVEWEWEGSPEITVYVAPSLEAGVAAFNTQSPRFVASLVSEDQGEHEAFWASIDAPFVGDGFTRWVDGQYAYNKPELGLSNWDSGRLFARGAVLSGDSVFTLRARVRQSDDSLHR